MLTYISWETAYQQLILCDYYAYFYQINIIIGSFEISQAISSEPYVQEVGGLNMKICWQEFWCQELMERSGFLEQSGYLLPPAGRKQSHA